MSNIHVSRTEFVSGTYHFDPSKNPPERNKLHWESHWKPHHNHNKPNKPIKMPERQTSVDPSAQGTPPVHSPTMTSPSPSGLFSFNNRERTTSINDESKIFT